MFGLSFPDDKTKGLVVYPCFLLVVFFKTYRCLCRRQRYFLCLLPFFVYFISSLFLPRTCCLPRPDPVFNSIIRPVCTIYDRQLDMLTKMYIKQQGSCWRHRRSHAQARGGKWPKTRILPLFFHHTSDKTSGDFRVKRGVRQGCVLSLSLFNILTEMVMRVALDVFEGGVQIGGGRVTHLWYADNIIVLADSGSELQEMTDRMERACTKYELQIDSEEIKMMTTSETYRLALHAKPRKIVVVLDERHCVVMHP